MKKLKERIPLKYIYVLSACIAILLSVGLYYTYAMFTANVSSGNVVNMDTTLKYNFDIFNMYFLSCSSMLSDELLSTVKG